MQVQPITNQSNFKGIKLSNPDFNKVKKMAMFLEVNGFECLGHKKIYCNNNFKDKIKEAKFIRNHASFFEREFGVIFFPWSKEAYIMATPALEQFILPVVKECDEGASLNFLI